MEFWKRVHFFITSDCNERCRFCFKPDFECKDKENIGRIVNTLATNGVKEVIITGGEPLLVKNLDRYLRTLHDSEIYTAIHTNATLLNKKIIEDISEIVDEIDIPLDSINRKKQEYLRKKDCLPQIKEVLKRLQDKDIKIGMHTVANRLNIDEIPEIYDFLLKYNFDNWRIYEFNPDIIHDRFKDKGRYMEIEELRGCLGEEFDGGSNSFFGDFLLAEEKMLKYKDKRVQFVGISDYDRNPYFFVNSLGDVSLATWFSQKRKIIGNILNEGFNKVKDRAKRKYNDGIGFDEKSFIETMQDQPLFARAAYEGNYFSEELEEIEEQYHDKFYRLSKLYLARIKRQGYAKKDAELAFDYYPMSIT
jgi:MoaA/NifB/PqqE/SkfB family radical SAM enzyme